MTKFIVEFNSKGGVGKTITATTLGHKLALEGNNTLIVDLDTQGQVATSLGHESTPGIYNWLVKAKPLDSNIINTRSNLYILPGNQTTELTDRHFTNMAEMEIEATGSDKSKFVLAVEMMQERISDLISDDYDCVLFDCPPRRSSIVEAVLGMADIVVIPTSMSSKDIAGTFTAVALTRKLNPEARIIISPNRVNLRSTYDSAAMIQLREDAGDVEISIPIPTSELIKPVEDSGKTVWEWDRTVSNTLARVKIGYCELFSLVKSAEK